MATVLMPTPLRRLTGGQAKVEIEGQDIGTLIQAIDAQYPGVADKLLDDDGCKDTVMASYYATSAVFFVGAAVQQFLERFLE